MQPDEYRVACQHPQAFTRGALEETRRVLKDEAPELVALVEQVLAEAEIEKPSQHTGEEWSDYFGVQIGLPEAEIIRDAFVDKEVEAVSPDGSTTALARHYAGMADAWTGYLLWLEDGAV